MSNSAPSAAATEVLDALATTTERETRGGALWCPPATGSRLRRAVLTRDRHLPGLARRAVRLAVAMEAAGMRGGYAVFLYALPALRRDVLVAAFARAAAAGTLPGGITVTAAGLRFDSAAMAPPRGGAFDLDAPSFPLIAAYLDALHNMLGFADVARLLAPALDPAAAPGQAETCAATLHAALTDWLRPRLEPEHFLRQCRALRGHLSARGVFRADEVDDAAVLAIWQAEGIDAPRIDGFRLFRNAARLVLAYRRALRLAEEEHAAGSGALSLGEDADGGEVSLETVEAGTEYGRFRSPLAMLATPPCDRVKWLTTSDAATLSGFVDSAPEGDSAGVIESSSLFAGDPPDARLALTVLRADVFGAEQSRLAERRRRGLPADTTALPEQSYVSLRDAIAARGETVALLTRATTYALLQTGRIEGLALVADHDPALIRLLRPVAAPNGAAPLIAALLAATDPPLRSFVSALAAAFRSVNRAGFRRGDEADPQMTEALAAGALWLPRLSATIRSIVDPLALRDLAAAFDADRHVFAAAFDRLYRDGA